MEIKSVEDFRQDFTEIGNDKLSINLERIKKGNDKVLITPQAKRVGPNELLQAWDQVFQSNLSDINDDLFELEESNRSKFGPRSIAKPWTDIRQSVVDGFNIPRVDCSHLVTRPPSTQDIGKLRPISLPNSAKLTRSNTQAGAPTLEKKGQVRDSTLSDWLRLYDMDLLMVPAIRTQEQQKTRLVNIYPYADIMQENRYFIPLFNLLKSEFCFSAFLGPDAVDSAITQLIATAVDMGYQCISGDIEGFDVSVGVDLQHCSFTEFKSYFQAQTHTEIDEIEYRFGNKGLITPEGVFLGPHGIPSGSNLTGIIGSMTNRQVSQHPPELSNYLGDDFALVAKTSDEVFAKYESAGLTLNRDKTLVKPSSFVYLQKLHHVDYVVDGEYKGVYPIYRALNRLCYPERFSDFNDYDLTGSDYFAIRSLSIMENCKYHPLFEKFVKFWMRYDNNLVPSSDSISDYVKMLEEGKGALGTTNQYGDIISGLRKFASYKIVAGLA
jgi:hypothetical protein